MQIAFAAKLSTLYAKVCKNCLISISKSVFCHNMICSGTSRGEEALEGKLLRALRRLGAPPSLKYMK